MPSLLWIPWIHRGRNPALEVSSPGLTWILGFLWSPHRGVRPRLECRHACLLSSWAVAAVSGFPSHWHRDLWLSWRLSHRAVTRANVVWVDTQRESRGSAGKSGSSGVDWDIWGTFGMVARPPEFLSTFLLRAPPLEMRRERQESFSDGARNLTSLTKDQTNPPLCRREES